MGHGHDDHGHTPNKVREGLDGDEEELGPRRNSDMRIHDVLELARSAKTSSQMNRFDVIDYFASYQGIIHFSHFSQISNCFLFFDFSP
jgi:hypothetical protein